MKKANNLKPIRAKRFAGTMTKQAFLNKIIELIDRVDVLLQDVRFSEPFEEWRGEVNSLLCFAFGDDSAQVSDFANVRYWSGFAISGQPDYIYDNEFRDGLKSAKAVLTTIQKEVAAYFPPDQDAQDEDIDNGGKTKNRGKDVFIVHGHDEVLRLEVEKVVRGLGLNAIVLKDQANEGMTLIQKFEKNSDNVCFVIVLLTADDESTTKKDGRKELHARQNVVFEMGYFFHVFRCADGAHRGLFAILENGVTKPGDIDGLVYQAYSKGNRSWILSLIKELDAAGVDFDRAKIPSIL